MQLTQQRFSCGVSRMSYPLVFERPRLLPILSSSLGYYSQNCVLKLAIPRSLLVDARLLLGREPTLRHKSEAKPFRDR